MNPFIGEIRLFPYTRYVPDKWLLCDGATLQISHYQALYSIIETTYGGDGRRTFCLPDLRGRVAVGAGAGSLVGNYELGEMIGTDSVALGQEHLPFHDHEFTVVNKNGAVNAPGPTVLPARDNSNTVSLFAAATGTVVPMSDRIVVPAGGSATHDNRQPYLELCYCIACEGDYPAPGND